MSSVATAGHHMMAGITNPNPMFKCPDQMIKVHNTALSRSVRSRYREIAFLEVSRIDFLNKATAASAKPAPYASLLNRQA